VPGVPVSRDHRTSLLVRPPSVVETETEPWCAQLIDPVEQLAELASLHARGLISRCELEAQVAKVIAAVR
jgi:hypothetical protein